MPATSEVDVRQAVALSYLCNMAESNNPAMELFVSAVRVSR